MFDTRTPANLGYKPSPTRAERDTWIPLETVAARRERAIAERIARYSDADLEAAKSKALNEGSYGILSLAVRPLRIAAGVHEAVARHEESKPVLTADNDCPYGCTAVPCRHYPA